MTGGSGREKNVAPGLADRDREARAAARLDALIAATSDVIYRMSPDWREMQPLDGRSLVHAHHAPSVDWMERNIPADEHARIRAAIAVAIARKSLFEMEHRVFGPDGTERWAHSRAVPLLDACGDIVEWFGVARDITDSRRVEEDLRESEQRFRSVFEQSTGGIAQVDLGGNFVLVNDRYCELVGRSREELLGMRMQDLTHPDDIAPNVSLFGMLARGEIADFTIEKRYLRPDGTQVWVHNAVAATSGDDGQVRYITAIVADISDLRTAKELEAALSAQRQLALDAARLGWWQYDPATGLVTHDRRYAEIYGIDGAASRHVDEINRLIEPEDSPGLWAAVQQSIEPIDPKPYSVEYRIHRPDGAVRWLEARGIAHFTGEGASRTVSSLVGTVGDVTERRVADEILRENEARFRLMADAAPATLWLTDAQGYCTFLSRQWYELTGQTEEEALGIGWTNATHPDDQHQATQTFLDANARQAFFRSEYRLRTADGSYRWAIDLGRPWFSESGEYAGMVGAVFDIDARKRAEEELAAASRRKDHFLATLAHELRNPLAPISNALQAWPRVKHKPEDADRLREMMGRQVQQMVRLIDDLLDVSRITRGKIELRRAPVDLAAALGAAVEAMQPFVDSHRHELHVSLPDAPLVVDADLGRLVQVFGNLLHNAAKYTPAGGHIALTASRVDGEAHVSVRDNGAGIPAGMLDEVFEMFAQVDQSIGRAHGGLGIGLTLVRNLVELHGGKVAAFSEGSGRGTEIRVCLPLAASGADAPVPTSLQSQAWSNLPVRRVLVVDDVEASANTFALMAKGLGQDAIAVYDGASALAAIETFAPDVAFIDIAMPGMDGYEVARRIQASSKPRPMLVALTGYGQAEDRQRAHAAGFDHHLTKPTNLDALAELLVTLSHR